MDHFWTCWKTNQQPRRKGLVSGDGKAETGLAEAEMIWNRYIVVEETTSKIGIKKAWNNGSLSV